MKTQEIKRAFILLRFGLLQREQEIKFMDPGKEAEGRT